MPHTVASASVAITGLVLSAVYPVRQEYGFIFLY